MKTYKKLLISAFVAFAFFSFFGNTKAATLSQTSITVGVGQTSTIYATNIISSIYLTNNSNPSIASVSVVGNNINIYGIAIGNSVATICDNTNSCTSVYITVGNNGSTYGTLSLSQTSLSLSIGQTSIVSAYNTYGTTANLYVSNNSNSSVASATVTGNNISIYGNAVGSSTITVCQSYNVSCGTIYVTVSGYGYGGSTNNGLGLNISSMTMATGTSATISASNNLNYSETGLYVSSNSNPNVVSTSSSSSGIPGCYAGAIYSTTTGQLCTGGSYYSSSSSAPYIPGCYAGATYSITTGQLCSGGIGVNNGSVTISAISPGSDTITFCQSGGGVVPLYVGGASNCSTMYITVTGYAVPINYPYNESSTSGIPTVYSTTPAN